MKIKKILYINGLKNWEFDKEAPQNFCLDRVTIAEREGASEDRNTTLLKINYSSYLCICVLFFLWSISLLHAREPYHVKVRVNTTSAFVSAPNLVDLSRDLSGSSLQDLIPIYTPVSPVSFGINLRGILAQASFAANSTALVVQIPQAGITTTFMGATRDDSIKLFKDSIKEGGTRHKLLRAYSKYSPIDPIAGNPNSLQALMATSDYYLATLYPFKGCSDCCNSQPSTHYFQGGLTFERAFSKGFETSSVTFPFRYSYSPRCSGTFILDAPLTYNKNGGASSLSGSLGMGWQIPVTPRWSLTPVLRLGSGGSLDLATSSCLFSAGISSVCYFPFTLSSGRHVLAVTNYASYVTSTNLWLTGINFTYHLHNFIFKNGISLTSCEGFLFCNRRVNYGISFVDSCFTHDSLYIDHYDEVTANIFLTCVNPRLKYDSLSLGFSYQFGEESFKGYAFKAIYQF